MSKLTEVYKDVPLSTPLLLGMHEILAEDTMLKDEIGRLRTNADDITVGNLTETVYVTPDDSFMRLELQRLIDYANDTDSQQFVHPIVKAIILHFWIGYLHPFTNGNGRVARALFSGIFSGRTTGSLCIFQSRQLSKERRLSMVMHTFTPSKTMMILPIFMIITCEKLDKL